MMTYSKYCNKDSCWFNLTFPCLVILLQESISYSVTYEARIVFQQGILGTSWANVKPCLLLVQIPLLFWMGYAVCLIVKYAIPLLYVILSVIVWCMLKRCIGFVYWEISKICFGYALKFTTVFRQILGFFSFSPKFRDFMYWNEIVQAAVLLINLLNDIPFRAHFHFVKQSL